MKLYPNLSVFLLMCLLVLSGCKSVEDHIRGVRDESGEKVTVGKVQAEIQTGMSGAQVAEVLGSPNIVTTDEERREVWIYDKFKTETSAGGSILIVGLIDSFLGGVAPSNKSSSGATSKSQKTMTIIIKFDKDKKVRDFAYHQSSF